MNILAIVGSPRKNGNNDGLIDSMLKGLESSNSNIYKYSVQNLNIKPCIACGGCEKSLGCIFKDDMTELYKKFDMADVIIISSPLYFNSVSAQLKSIIDRCQAIWASKYILNESLINTKKYRVGYFICTAGMPHSPELFDATIPIMDLFFKSVNCDYLGNLFVGNIDKHPIFDDNTILQKAYRIGSQIKERLEG